MGRWRRALGLLGLLSGVACERGGLTNWFVGHGLVHRDGARSESLRMNEVDCPAGLVRCVEGIIEVAKASRHPEPCKEGSEGCACPWLRVGRCEHGCVSDGVGISFQGARTQVCLPGAEDPLVGVSPPLGAASPSRPPTPCGGELFRCDHSMVIACAPQRVLANCLRGCVEEPSTLDDEAIGEAAAVNLLCAR
jgi:hypothetical protein